MIAIIDSKAMAYLELHAGKPTVNLFDTVANCLQHIEGITSVVFAYDIGKSRYRLGLWDGYKGKRNYSVVPSTFSSTYERVVPQIASYLGIKNIYPNEVEADDIAGILCAKEKNKDIVLLTVDHDWFGLVLRHDKVKLFDVKKFILYDKAMVREFTKCHTEEQFIIKKCIMGDSGDNIIGIPTIGPIKYQKWADEIYSKPEAIHMEFLKKEFLKLCESTSKEHKTHREYMYAGVHSCEELLDYNIKLGTIMGSLSLLDDNQKAQIKHYYSIPLEFNRTKVTELVRDNCEGATSPFGDPYSLSPSTLKYFERIYNASTDSRTKT